MDEWRPGQPPLSLARDLVGKRSLFYGRRPDGSVVYGRRFGELITALDRPPLDRVSLATYLSTGYVPGPATLVLGIFSVPPATAIRFDERGEAAESMPLPSVPVPEGDDAQRALLRFELEGAVERCLPDGPVAASLSGGIDSSLVVALAARQRQVCALSITFGAPHRDELQWSAMVARHCGASHEIVMISPASVRERFDATVIALSIPNGDPLTVPNDCLFSAAAERGLSVMLNGEGGDPCFGGPKNAPMLLAELYGGGNRASAYLRAHQKLWDELDEVLHPDYRPPGLHEQVESLLSPSLAASDRSLLDRLMALNVMWKGAGHILPKVEHLAARHGVEARSPLFDPRLVALSSALPPQSKRRGATEKWLLKEAVSDLLPAEIIERPKSGMMVPVEAWFQGPLREWASERLLDGLAPRDILSRNWLARLAAKELGGLRPRHGVKVWLLLTLEAWLRCVYDPNGTPPRGSP